MVKIIKMLSGEFVIAEQNVVEQSNFWFSNPALIMPTQQGLSLTKYIPFSKYSDEENNYIQFCKSSVICITTPEKSLANAYKQWVDRNRSQESGIITASPTDVTKLDPIGK